jgi:hypothetical protein
VTNAAVKVLIISIAPGVTMPNIGTIVARKNIKISTQDISLLFAKNVLLKFFII